MLLKYLMGFYKQIFRLLVLLTFLICSSQYATWANDFNYDADLNSKHALEVAKAAIKKTNELLDANEFEKALSFSETALELSETAGFTLGAVEILYIRGIICRITGDYAHALVNFYKSIEVYKILEDKIRQAYALNNIGSIYRIQGNYPGALDYLLAALAIFQSNENLKGTASALNNIGIVYFYQKDFNEALKYYLESLKIEEELNDKFGISVSYINIGEVHKHLGNYDDALEYYLKALEFTIIFEEKDDDRDGIGVLYNEIGSLHMHKGDFQLSLEYLEKALDIFEEIDSKFRISECKLYLGELYLNKNDIVKAQKYFFDALNKAKEVNALDLIAKSHKVLNKTYDLTNKPEKAYFHFKKHVSARDSLFNEKNTRQMVQASMLYEFEKQTQETKLQHAKQEAIANEIIRRQTLQKNFFIFGAMLFGVLALIVFVAYRQKQKNNVLITEKNSLLEMAYDEIRAQKDEIETQRDLVINQKMLIEGQKKRMDDSILYAKHIQSAVILSESYAINLFDDYFVIYRPKEVVSGDFYWATKINSNIIVVVADCTGHGVPGAFMSMMGVSFLNEIVKKRHIIDPAIIMEELRKVLIESLVLNSDEDMKREGMYVNIVSINIDTKQALWAGAKTPIWIIRNKRTNETTENKSVAFEELKPDNPSVAMQKKMRKYKSHKLQLQSGDKIYIFSDGIADQFGGPEGKKFSVKRLKDIILETANNSLAFQKIAIEEAVDNWQNVNHGEHYDQVDDITVFGLRI